MNNTTKRILTSVGMIAVAVASARFGLIRWLTFLIVIGMTAELVINMIKSKTKVNLKSFFLFLIPFLFLVLASFFVGNKPNVMLLLLIIIASADTGAWFFGKKFGKDKMWERISPNKTWVGQIAGIICGTVTAVIYGLFTKNISSMIWIGIGVSLLSQYGDLFTSAIKRKLSIKDFSNILPGHGGLVDRFDGWLFVLPVIWLTILFN